MKIRNINWEDLKEKAIVNGIFYGPPLLGLGGGLFSIYLGATGFQDPWLKEYVQEIPRSVNLGTTLILEGVGVYLTALSAFLLKELGLPFKKAEDFF